MLFRVRSKNTAVKEEATTIADAINEFNLSKVDFIKMDIQGGEFFVIESATGILKKLRTPLFISLHYQSLCEFYENKIFPYGVVRRLYRFFDSQKKYLDALVLRHNKKIFESLKFYQYSFDINLKPVDLLKLKMRDIQSLDGLVFSDKLPENRE